MRDTMLIIHFVGLAMGLGTSFAFMFLGMAAAKMEKTEAKKFTGQIAVIARMGQIGLALLIVTGLYLITPYWSVLADMPLLITKLVLVLILTVLVAIISITLKKAVQTGEDNFYAGVKSLGRISLITTLTIVVMAVLSFH